MLCIKSSLTPFQTDWSSINGNAATLAGIPFLMRMSNETFVDDMNVCMDALLLHFVPCTCMVCSYHLHHKEVLYIAIAMLKVVPRTLNRSIHNSICIAA